MENQSMQKSKDKALGLRLACYCSANENASLAKLAAHTWRHLWFFSGHPNFRTASLCTSPSRFGKDLASGLDWMAFQWMPMDSSIDLVCRANLRDAADDRIVTVIGEWHDFSCKIGERQPLSNTLAMECILRGDSDRLGALDVALLEECVFDPTIYSETVNAFQYGAMLGDVDCFAVLIRRLGVTSPLLVTTIGFGLDPLRNDVLICCDARFPFGNREGIFHLLLHHFAWHLWFFPTELIPRRLLMSASRFGAPWLLKFVFYRLEEAKTQLTENLDSCLFLASAEGHTDCVRLLLKQGADANASVEEFHSYYDFERDRFLAKPLIVAADQGNIEIARLLLEHGADVNAKDEDGCRALIWASEKGHPDCVRLLLEHGADVNAKDEDGCRALIWASEKGHPDCVRLLLEHGADVNDTDQDGWTALMNAIAGGHIGCARLLLEHGAEVNGDESCDGTPLMFAISEGHTGCVRLLLEHGAHGQLWARDEDECGYVRALISASGGHTDCVRLFLDRGADVNARWMGTTPLFDAVWHGVRNPDCALLLLERGADVNAVAYGGETVLMHACRASYHPNYLVCVRLLLEHGADVNAKDEGGNTALMRARQDNNADCVRLLLEHGAEEPE